jgi:hypothetical protein
VHEALQHTPSTQKFDPHSAAVAQARPLAFLPVWQVPAASQYCAPLQSTVAFRSCDPAATFTQLPSLCETAHDWQVPRQALLQQKVSTQKLLPQSVLVVQLWPFGFLFVAQVPAPLQYWDVPSQGVVALWSGSPMAIGVQLPGVRSHA